MKVLHVINSLNVGGAEKMLVDIMVYLKKYKDVQSHVLVLGPINKGFENRFFEESISFTVIDKSWLSLKKYIGVMKVLKEYDVIHSHLFPTNYVLSLFSLKYPKKVFITTEHSTHNRRRDYPILNLLERFVYGRYKLILAISDKTKSKLVSWLGSDFCSKVVVVHNGVELSSYSNVSSNYNHDLDLSKKCTLLMIGSFREQKNQDCIIRALKFLPEHVRLRLAGCGDRKEILVKLADDLGVLSRVDFLGLQSDIPSIISSSDIVIQSSHWEGFGLAAVEGMAASKPVIASNVDGLREVVDGYGLLFEPDNSEQLAELVDKLIMNKEMYCQVSNNCFLRSKDFEIKRLVNLYVENYRVFMIENNENN